MVYRCLEGCDDLVVDGLVDECVSDTPPPHQDCALVPENAHDKIRCAARSTSQPEEAGRIPHMNIVSHSRMRVRRRYGCDENEESRRADDHVNPFACVRRC